MNNLNVSLILENIANLLKIKGANRYKIAAYEDASKKINRLPMDIKQLYLEDKITSIEGIGSGLAKKIEEILTTGECKYYQDLSEEYPLSLISLLKVEGLGPAKVRKIYEELEVTTLKELKAEAEAGNLSNVSGIGAKTENKILKSVEKLLPVINKLNLVEADDLAEKFKNYLLNLNMVKAAEVVGEVRRRKEIIGNIFLVVEEVDLKPLIKELEDLALVVKVDMDKEEKLILNTVLGIEINLYLASYLEFNNQVFWLTGSQQFNNRLKEIINEDLSNLEGSNDEEEFFTKLKLPYIIPELRDDIDSLEAAKDKSLPNSIKSNDIRGDLHLHSNWSDGRATIKEMALACQKRGYDYLAITDHTSSLTITNGLTYDELESQGEEIDKVNEEVEIKILKSSEVDILTEKLDYTNDLLQKLDIVTASIHSGFEDGPERIMKRLFLALENPYVNILGHPTGRLLFRRSSYKFNFEKLVEKAVETDTALEINASPKRLDLDSEKVKFAKEKGAKFVINTDAHTPNQLDYMKYGVGIARRGWLEKDDVINCFSLERLKNKIGGNK